tara:strand:- start:4138 stop:4443 length:306 start_codon:yes stop_codon:yes gene_type:complete
MDAISKIRLKDRQLKRASIWSVRWKFVDGEYVLANAKPCSICKNVALNSGIRTVYYSSDDGKIYRENLLSMESSYTTGSLIYMRDNLHYKNVKFKPNKSSG